MIEVNDLVRVTRPESWKNQQVIVGLVISIEANGIMAIANAADRFLTSIAYPEMDKIEVIAKNCHIVHVYSDGKTNYDLAGNITL